MAATVPAAVVGLVGQDAVERRLGRPGPTAALLAGAGLLLLAADRRPEDRSLDRTAVVAAGVAQVAALAPGVSRQGATLTALRLRRVPRDEALRASLLLSLPITTGAAALTGVRGGRAPAPVPTALAAVGAAAAHRVVSRRPGALVTAAAVYRLGVAAAVAARLRREKR